ncbi:CBS domain-containing protein [Streptosporangium sandarakinum]|uniref:CBS domain-containing protein n=1 Tax=Streptosporangium sandarakinum TaxID=1260955 RepID=UPI0033BAF9AA
MVMRVKDVMGRVAIAVQRDATFAELVATMRRFKVDAVAVVNADGRPVGTVSEDDLLPGGTGLSPGETGLPSGEAGLPRGEDAPAGGGRHPDHRRIMEMTAEELMASPAPTVVGETPIREAALLMHVNGVRQLPVIDAVSGRIAGTVHQADLLRIFARRAPEVLADVAAAVARLRLDPRTLTISVDAGVVRIQGRLARRSQIARLAEAAQQADGVVDLRIDVTYDHDDLAGDLNGEPADRPAEAAGTGRATLARTAPED